MRLHFWRREPLPDLSVDRTADTGTVPLDTGAALHRSPGAHGYVEGAELLAELGAETQHVDYFRPDSPRPD